MRVGHFILLNALFFSCTQAPKDQKEEKQDSTAAAAFVQPVDTTMDVSLGQRPAFPKYSNRVYTHDENEMTITPLVDSILDEYSHRNYFSIKYSFRIYHFDQQKRLRVVTEEYKTKTSQDYSIYLFDHNQLVASYRDADLGGQDTQILRERIMAGECPTCGVAFNMATNYDTLVNVLNEARVKELSDYYVKETNELLDWLAQATVYGTRGNSLIFERVTPYKETYTVNAELFNKFIRYRKPVASP